MVTHPRVLHGDVRRLLGRAAGGKENGTERNSYYQVVIMVKLTTLVGANLGWHTLKYHLEWHTHIYNIGWLTPKIQTWVAHTYIQY